MSNEGPFDGFEKLMFHTVDQKWSSYAKCSVGTVLGFFTVGQLAIGKKNLTEPNLF